jgi:hypothetical protein
MFFLYSNSQKKSINKTGSLSPALTLGSPHSELGGAMRLANAKQFLHERPMFFHEL